MQRLLQPCQVVIPFATRLGELLDYKRVELRRGFPQIMSMIQTVTLLHQWQRERDSEGRLLATAEDYRLARGLLAKPMEHLLGAGISDPALRFFEHLKVKWGEREFTTTQTRTEAGKSKEAIRGWLGELLDAGLVKLIAEARGPRAATWQLTGSDPEVCTVLPKVEEVFNAECEWSHAHST
jgi:DNA primase